MKQFYAKKFGTLSVEVTRTEVSVIGEYNSNFGTVYPDNVGKTGNFGEPKQTFGMEWNYGLTDIVIAYIKLSILKLYN